MEIGQCGNFFTNLKTFKKFGYEYHAKTTPKNPFLPSDGPVFAIRLFFSASIPYIAVNFKFFALRGESKIPKETFGPISALYEQDIVPVLSIKEALYYLILYENRRKWEQK